MKLLLDQGLPRSTAAILRQSGEDAIHVGEIAMGNADDVAILQRGRAEQRVVVTFDADFHKLLALAGAATPSVIRIRIEGLRAEACADLIGQVVAQSRDELVRGAALTVTENRIRVRRLPLHDRPPTR